MDDWDALEEFFGENFPHTTYTFTLDRPLLFLNASTCERLGLITRTVELEIHDDCLGSPTTQWILSEWIGYDTLMLNLLARTFREGSVRTEYPSLSVYDLKDMITPDDEILDDRTVEQFIMFVLVYPTMFWALYTCVSFYCNNLETRSIPAFRTFSPSHLSSWLLIEGYSILV